MTEWNENSIIQNFRNCRAGQFCSLQEELGLKMSEDRLTGCAVYCALTLHRDPTFGELRLWDRLLSLSPSPRHATLAALETESPAIAETYADMMKKYSDLSEEGPLSFERALTLASDTLERGGKERALTGFDLRLTDAAYAPFDPAPILENRALAGLSILGKAKSRKQLEINDICLLVTPGELTHYEFESAIGSLLFDSAFTDPLHGVFRLTESGILPALLSSFNGFYIDLSRLGLQPTPAPEILAGNFAGDWLLILPQKEERLVREKINQQGMQGFSFAILTKGRKIEIATPVHRLAVDTDFLRSLIPEFSNLSVILQNDPADLQPISHTLYAEYPCRLLPTKAVEAEVCNRKGVFSSAASTTLQGNAFQSAFLTALVPVLACALAGTDYPNMRLATNWSFPTKGFDASCAFASAIGFYRLQAELGIPTATNRISECNCNAPSLEVFAIGKGVAFPAAKLTALDSKIYLIPIAFSEQGLPDFSALRDLLSNLAAQAQNKIIRSARLVVQNTPEAVLAEMQSDALSACKMDSAEVLTSPLTLGVLIETAYEMPFECVATVQAFTPKKEKKVVKSEVPKVFRVPNGNGLIWRKQPETAILAPARSPEALKICRYLQQLGVNAKAFTPDEEGLFLRAVLTANVVYRFSEVPLPRNKQANFAFSILHGNGGEIRCLRKQIVKSSKK